MLLYATPQTINGIAITTNQDNDLAAPLPCGCKVWGLTKWDVASCQREPGWVVCYTLAGATALEVLEAVPAPTKEAFVAAVARYQRQHQGCQA